MHRGSRRLLARVSYHAKSEVTDLTLLEGRVIWLANAGKSSTGVPIG